MPNTEYKRRPFLTSPGEPLVLGQQSPVLAAIRFGKFNELTGLDASDTTSSPLVGIPLPRYRRTPEGPRRWLTTRPEAMWHPLMWLPSRLAGLVALRTNEEGRVLEAEDADSWAVRVCLEMEASGLYNQEDGTWIDCLALVGIDIDTEEGVQRVRDWLHGGPDEALDNLSLTEHLDIGDESWAFRATSEWMPSLQCAAWAMSAESLLDTVETLIEDEDDEYADDDPPAERQAVAANLANLAKVHLDGADDTDWGAHNRSLASFGGSEKELIDGPIGAFVEDLKAVLAQYETVVDRMNQFTDDMIAQGAEE